MITTHSGLRRALTENRETQEYIEVHGLPIEYAKTIIEHSISGYLGEKTANLIFAITEN